MRRLVLLSLLAALAGAVTVTAGASHRTTDKAIGRVVGVPTGDTLVVKIGKAKPARVRILGIHAPAGGSCYAHSSAAAARSLALGRQVTLVGDLKQGAAYAALPTGEDLGFLLLSRGAVQVDSWSKTFSRLPQYAGVQETVERAGTGMWGACAADLQVTMTGPDTGLVGQALTYNVVVRNAGPLGASHVDLQLRPGAYSETLVSAKTPNGTCTVKTWMATCAIDPLAAGASIPVTAVMRGSNFGIMSGRADVSLQGCLSAQCGAAPLLDPNLDSNRAAVVTLLPGGGYAKACEPSYPSVCIPLTPPDLDCEDFLPLKNFPVRYDVPNPDPHHLDGDGNGIACQPEDY